MDYKLAREIVHRFQTGDVYYASYTQLQVDYAYDLLKAGKPPNLHPTPEEFQAASATAVTLGVASQSIVALRTTVYQEGTHYLLGDATVVPYRERTRTVQFMDGYEQSWAAASAAKINKIVDDAHPEGVTPLTVDPITGVERLRSFNHMQEILPGYGSGNDTIDPLSSAPSIADILVGSGIRTVSFDTRTVRRAADGGILWAWNEAAERYEGIVTYNGSRYIETFASNVEGGRVAYKVSKMPLNGTLNWTEKNVMSGMAINLVYMPNKRFSGEDTLEIEATSISGKTTLAQVFLKVNAALPVDESTRVNAYDMGIFSGWEDAEEPIITRLSGYSRGQLLDYKIVSHPSNGTLKTSDNGAVVIDDTISNNNPVVEYTPNPDFSGDDSFTFYAHVDGNEDYRSVTATVSIHVNEVNDCPITQDASITVEEDNSIVFNLGEYSTDPDDGPQPLSYEVAWCGVIPNNSEPLPDCMQGKCCLCSCSPCCCYESHSCEDPVPNEDLVCTEEYDPVCGTDGNTYSNDCYAARAGVEVAYHAACDVPRHGRLEDENGNALPQDVVWQPFSGQLKYTPTPEWSGKVCLKYRASDGQNFSEWSELIITTTAVNDPPICLAQRFVVRQDAQSGTEVGQIVFSDPDGSDAQITLTTVGGDAESASHFDVSPTGKITIGDNHTIFNPDVKSSFIITVRVEDQGGAWIIENMTVDVQRVISASNIEIEFDYEQTSPAIPFDTNIIGTPYYKIVTIPEGFTWTVTDRHEQFDPARFDPHCPPECPEDRSGLGAGFLYQIGEGLAPTLVEADVIHNVSDTLIYEPPKNGWAGGHTTCLYIPCDKDGNLYTEAYQIKFTMRAPNLDLSCPIPDEDKFISISGREDFFILDLKKYDTGDKPLWWELGAIKPATSANTAVNPMSGETDAEILSTYATNMGTAMAADMGTAMATYTAAGGGSASTVDAEILSTYKVANYSNVYDSAMTMGQLSTIDAEILSVYLPENDRGFTSDTVSLVSLDMNEGEAWISQSAGSLNNLQDTMLASDVIVVTGGAGDDTLETGKRRDFHIPVAPMMAVKNHPEWFLNIAANVILFSDRGINFEEFSAEFEPVEWFPNGEWKISNDGSLAVSQSGLIAVMDASLRSMASPMGEWRVLGRLNTDVRLIEDPNEQRFLFPNEQFPGGEWLPPVPGKTALDVSAYSVFKESEEGGYILDMDQFPGGEWLPIAGLPNHIHGDWKVSLDESVAISSQGFIAIADITDPNEEFPMSEWVVLGVFGTEVIARSFNESHNWDEGANAQEPIKGFTSPNFGVGLDGKSLLEGDLISQLMTTDQYLSANTEAWREEWNSLLENETVTDPYEYSSGWYTTILINNFGETDNWPVISDDLSVPTHQLLGYAHDGIPVYNQYSYVPELDPNSDQFYDVPSFDATSPDYDLAKIKEWEEILKARNALVTLRSSYNSSGIYVGGSGDLDEANGRFAPTKRNPAGEYHYVLTPRLADKNFASEVEILRSIQRFRAYPEARNFADGYYSRLATTSESWNRTSEVPDWVYFFDLPEDADLNTVPYSGRPIQTGDFFKGNLLVWVDRRKAPQSGTSSYAEFEICLRRSVTDPCLPLLSDWCGVYTTVENYINRPPTLDRQVFRVSENAPVGALVGVIQAVDPDADEVIVRSIDASPVAHFTGIFTNWDAVNELGSPSTVLTEMSPFIIQSTGAIKLQRPIRQEEVGSWIYPVVAQDARGANSEEISIAIIVESQNDLPIAHDMWFTVDYETSADLTLYGVDEEQHDLTFTILEGPFHGSLELPMTLAGDIDNPYVNHAYIKYTPDAGYSGPDHIFYTVNDGLNDSTHAIDDHEQMVPRAAKVWINVEESTTPEVPDLQIESATVSRVADSSAANSTGHSLAVAVTFNRELLPGEKWGLQLKDFPNSWQVVDSGNVRYESRDPAQDWTWQVIAIDADGNPTGAWVEVSWLGEAIDPSYAPQTITLVENASASDLDPLWLGEYTVQIGNPSNLPLTYTVTGGTAAQYLEVNAEGKILLKAGNTTPDYEQWFIDGAEAGTLEVYVGWQKFSNGVASNFSFTVTIQVVIGDVNEAPLPVPAYKTLNLTTDTATPIEFWIVVHDPDSAIRKSIIAEDLNNEAGTVIDLDHAITLQHSGQNGTDPYDRNLGQGVLTATEFSRGANPGQWYFKWVQPGSANSAVFDDSAGANAIEDGVYVMKLKYTPDASASTSYSESWSWSAVDWDFVSNVLAPAQDAGEDITLITDPYSYPLLFSAAANSAVVNFTVSATATTPPPPSTGLHTVMGHVPDWNQPHYYYPSKILDTASAQQAWCTPTAAACQLGHLNMAFGFDDPKLLDGFISGVNDQCDASFTKNPDMGDAFPQGTIPWGGDKGWGDYLIDPPHLRGYITYPYTPGVPHCETTDFGWFMDTNNIGRSGLTAGSPVGTTIQNGYKGLLEWYQVAGYDQMIGITYSKWASVPFPRHQGEMPELWHSNLLADSDFYGGADPWEVESDWETLKREINKSQTVIACMQGWAVSRLNWPMPEGFGSGGWPFTDPDNEQTDYYKIHEEVGGNDVLGETYTSRQHDGSWENALGHTVLIYGYIEAGSAEDISPNKDTNWILIRDNNHTTMRGVIVPFNTMDLSQWSSVGPVRFAENCVIAYIWNEFTRRNYNPATCTGTTGDPDGPDGPDVDDPNTPGGDIGGDPSTAAFMTGWILPTQPIDSTTHTTGWVLPSSEDGDA